MDIASISTITDMSLTTDDSFSSSSLSCGSYSPDHIETMTRKRVDVDIVGRNGVAVGDFIEDSSSVSFGKLLEALADFGFEAGSVRHRQLFGSLQVTDEDLVPFADFVRCVKDVYRSELVEKLAVGATTTVDAANERLLIENESLREENKNIKRQLKAMENACSKAEDNLIRIRKELQQQLENLRNLTSRLRTNSEAIRSDDDRAKEGATIKSQISNGKERRPSAHRDAASKLMNFIEELHRNLSEIKQPNRRVGRSCSLYRNSSCISALKRTSLTPQPRAVARAATVGTPSRTSSAVVSEKSSRLVGQDRLPRYVKGGRSHLDQSQLIRKIVDEAGVIIDTVKPILKEANEEANGSSENGNYFESSKNVSDVIKKLHMNLASPTVVTIMTRV